MDRERLAHLFEVSYRTRIKDGDHEGVPENFQALRERMDWRHPIQSLYALDAFLRQRNLGGPRERLERAAALITMGAVVEAVDLIDYAAEGILPAGPVGWLVGTMLEFATDTLIAEGADRVVQRLTGEDDVEFSSPLTRTAATITAAIPPVRQFTSGPLYETGLRLAYNVPIIGVPVEWAYRGLNWAIEMAQGDRGDVPEWLGGAVVALVSGITRRWWTRRTAPPPPPGPGAAPAPATP